MKIRTWQDIKTERRKKKEEYIKNIMEEKKLIEGLNGCLEEGSECLYKDRNVWSKHSNPWKDKSFFKTWMHFLVTIFITSCLTIFITIFGMHFGIKLNLFNNDKLSTLAPLLSIIVLNIVISLLFTFIIGVLMQVFLDPVSKLIEATSKVSKGDFSIRLDEKYVKHEILKMNVSFNKMVKELSSIETLRNDFVVSVSHEFKTPIAAIEGYATLLQDPSLSIEERQEYTKMILESSSQLSSLSGNILKLSKLETQQIAPEKNNYYLDEQIRQALLMLENQWTSKNIDIDLDMNPTHYSGPEDLLNQVWINLFSNAIKFTKNNGMITARLKAMDDKVIVSISDNGIGMSKEVRERVFEKFYQGDKSRTFEGNGLGLTLVKRIVDLCKGEIKIESEVNMGTTFIVSLPIDKS